MKIAIDARFYGLENAGLGRYTTKLIQNLAKIDKKNNYALFLRKKYFENLELPENFKKVLVDTPHYTAREQFVLYFKLRKVKPDLFHALNTNFPVFYNGRSIVTAHDTTQLNIDRFATTLPVPVYLIKSILYKWVYKKAVKKCFKVITPTKAVREDVVKRFDIDEEKATAIYEGVDPVRVKDKRISKVLSKYGLEKNKYFFYVGNAYPHKNLKRVVEAIVYLNKQTDETFVFAIASARGEFTRRLQKLIEKHRAEKFVRLLGFVPDKDLSALYAGSIAFVYPSLSEGFGLPGLEAMSAKTLVLASNTPVFKEVYGKAAFYFNPYDFSAIAKAMKDVIEMRDKKREKYIKRGKKQVKKYSWKKMAKETLKIYEEAS